MCGYFNDESKEYVITEMFPRRKWLNYLWNETLRYARAISSGSGRHGAYLKVNAAKSKAESGI